MKKLNSRPKTKKKTSPALAPAQDEPSASAQVRDGVAEKNSFPVVGVGASAGGLEAFTELLKALKPDLGMAFVLVPHLDPTHASSMAELLSRATSMPVRQVTQGTRVETDHVYIIPPNQDMKIVDGVLQLHARDRDFPRMPIDSFFRSLAEDKQSNAIGVILSGTASDGTLGITAIKAEGGITFAQDSKSAKYDGMPGSAAASGAIDFVMPPARIAAELARIRVHPYISMPPEREGEELAIEGDPGLTHLFRILKQVSRVDFSEYKPGTIRRRISRRMALKRIENLKDYIAYVRDNRAEAEALYKDILINVTNFFRNPEVFVALKETVYPALLKERQPGDTIRIWVPGCSTGEEAYSHAIALAEYLADVRADVGLQVFGTDLSESAVQHARSGIFTKNIMADVSPTRLRRFFTVVEEGYQISKSIRDTSIFARQNIFGDPPFSKLDMISCRNVLIYLGHALQRRVVPTLHYALRPNGYLVVGSTEGLVGSPAELFDVVDRKHKIYKKRPVESLVTFGASMVDRLQERGAGAAHAAATREEGKGLFDLQKETDRLLLQRYAPAAVVVNENMDILQTRGHTGRFLELPPGKASLNLLRMARSGLLFELQKTLDAARRKGAAVRQEGVQLESNGGPRVMNLEVVPLKVAAATPAVFIIIFEDATAAQVQSPQRRRKLTAAEERGKDQQIARLTQELAAAKEYLQSVIEEREATNEELQSANEEIQSANEELQSTNEELQTSKEELESANEELNTVNEEMNHRNQQLSQTYNDLSNLLNSVNIPVVMMSSDLKVRQFTPRAERVLGLNADDIGRVITKLQLKVDVAELEAVAVEVMRDILPKQQELEDGNGNRFVFRMTPYRTSDNRIEGVVLTVLETGDTSTPPPATPLRG